MKYTDGSIKINEEGILEVTEIVSLEDIANKTKMRIIKDGEVIATIEGVLDIESVRCQEDVEVRLKDC